MSSSGDLLREVPLFQWLNERERERLTFELETVHCQAGEYVFHYGDPGDSLYIIQAGEAEVFTEDHLGQRIVLAVLGPRAVFGELSLFDGGSRTASVVARTDLTTLQLNRAHLEHYIQSSPAAALELLALMGRHLRENAEQLRTTTRNVNTAAAEGHSSFIHHIAEWVAEFSGSIPFLIIHIALFTWWILVNMSYLPGRVFDPYPFGLLSMAVSVEAVILSVFVLLSQNRQRRQDQIRSDIEYEINLKAEMEISHLHSKIDQWNSRFFMELREIRKRLDPLRANETQPQSAPKQ